MNRQSVRKCHRHRESGMALILAIGFLAVLSILGAVVLTVSTRELKSSGSFLPGKRAFYAADRAVEYSMNRDIILSLSPTETIDLVNNVRRDKAGNVLGATTYDNKAVIDSSGGGTLSSGTVSDLGPNELPPSVAELFGNDYGSNFYHVEVEAQAPGNREANVNASIVRLFKSDDDTIFITTGVK